MNLLGEYGSDTIPAAIVFERGGRLRARFASGDTVTLDQTSDTSLATTGAASQSWTLRRGPQGDVTALGSWPRHLVGPELGGQLRLTPVRPVAEVLVDARRAVPPAESGSFRRPALVEVTTLDSTIHLEIRYATTNDFLGSVFYSSAHAFLQRPAAEALAQVERRLRPYGYGLLIHDAYRPWFVTKTFWDATPPDKHWLVANPARGSKHNRGCAVDLTLYDLRTGRPVDMGGTYDEATPRSFSDYPVATDLQYWHRELLHVVMVDAGFERNPEEWWHFDYRDWRQYPILNATFEELTAASASGR